MNNSVQIKVLFFAKSRDLVGQKEAVVDTPSAVSGKQLLHILLDKFPSISPISESIVLSLNEDYVDLTEEELAVSAGDELAVIPPISGG